MEWFPCPVKDFPCSYLGLPLHTRQLRRRVDTQPLIDKMASRLPAWQGRFLNKAGRLKLLNSVLTSHPNIFPHGLLTGKMGDQEAGQNSEEVISVER